MDTKKQKNSRHRILKRMSELSGIPGDVVLGAPIVTITGQWEIKAENYQGILEYTDHYIRLRAKIGQIHISGTGLKMDYYTNEELKISGKVTAIEYLDS